MRSRISRHLGLVLGEPPDDSSLDEALTITGPGETPLTPSELSGRDYAIFLLRLAAEVEHALMVQYLFTAYSLGAPGLPAERQAEVRAWQETMLGIAKEEMAHLVTVENLLTRLSAPLNFNREEFPHDTLLYPFGFKLERASLESIAAFVCAESPRGVARRPRGARDQGSRQARRGGARQPRRPAVRGACPRPRRSDARGERRLRRGQRRLPGELGRVGPRLSRGGARRGADERLLAAAGARAADPRGRARAPKPWRTSTSWASRARARTFPPTATSRTSCACSRSTAG